MSATDSTTNAKRSTRLLRSSLLLLLVVAVAIPCWIRVFKDHRLRAVRSALLESDTKRALELLEELDGFESSNAEVLHLLAIALRREDQLYMAHRCLDRARLLGLDEGAVELQHQLSRVQSGDLSQVASLASILNSDEVSELDSLQVVEALAKGNFAAHRIREAVEYLNDWIKWQPTDPTPRLLMADMWSMSGEESFAIKEYREVLRIDPQHEIARRRLAWSLVETNQIEDAGRELDILRERGIDGPKLRIAEAMCRERLGHREQAKKLLQDVLNSELPVEGRVFVRVELAKIALDEARYDDAIGQANSVIESKPNNEALHHILATAHSKAGREDQAEFHFAKSRELRRQQERIAEIRRALIESPSDLELRHEAGQLSKAMGLSLEAVRWFKSVIQIDPGHGKSHVALAACYRDLGDNRLADYHQRIAANLESMISIKEK